MAKTKRHVCVKHLYLEDASGMVLVNTSGV